MLLVRAPILFGVEGLGAAPAERPLSGEPYRLRGNRIVFTNRFFVRQGALAWVDDAGNTVSADYRAKIEDRGAHFRTWDMPRGVRLVARPAQRRADVIRPEKPWEKRFSVTTLIQDGGRLRFWGSCGQPCYLESTDGVTWERPVLGLVEFEGSRENNLCPGVPGGFLFLDPAAPPEERYKALGTDTISGEELEATSANAPETGTLAPAATTQDMYTRSRALCLLTGSTGLRFPGR